MDDKDAKFPKDRLEELEKQLKVTLSDLFQIDSPALDFGVYRIMNQKRDEITRFMDRDLVEAVDEEIGKYAGEVRNDIIKEGAALERRIREEIAADALTSSGIKEAYLNSKLARDLNERWLDMEEREKEASMSNLQKESIFEHLTVFFSRYYRDGDFLSLRRYSANEKYAVPYNGEEVLLHWANKDQYYIKTDRFLKGHGFDVGAYRVMFEVVQAEEQANAGGGKRYFVLSGGEDEVTYDETKKLLTVRFAQVPLSDEELLARFPPRGTRKNPSTDDIVGGLAAAIVAHECIPKGLKDAFEAKERDTDANPRLRKHVLGFTKESTSDFFIHKDLGGFLRQELDFYIKNEVFRLDDLGTENEVPVERYVKRAKVFKSIANRIIDFLAQLEDFQKMLWEKKKFVLQTDYCMTIDHIPEKYYPEICAKERQVQKWKDLYKIGEGAQQTLSGDAIDVAFLKSHPYLVLDTAFFDAAFKNRLLEDLQHPDGTPVEDLDEAIGGLMIKSENWQALNLLQERYREQVKCIHIDPPYNTQTSGFLYKNSYQHSSWLSMMMDRYNIGIRFLSKSGVFACHIDEAEKERLHLLFESFPLINAGTMIWDKGQPNTGSVGLATQHEYVLFRTKENLTLNISKKNIGIIQNKVKELLKKYGSPNREAISTYRKWLKLQPGLSEAEATYDQFDETGRAFRSDNMSATDRRKNEKFYVPLVHPITGKNCPVPDYGWRYTPESMGDLLRENLILFGKDHTSMPRKKTYIETTRANQMSTVYKSGMRGKTVLDHLNLEFPFSHSVDFYSHIIEGSSSSSDRILDFFSGSGTTAHAILNLNREDKGNRKYILIEMGDYFDTVTRARIEKVAYSSNWKDGTPQDSTSGQSHIFKYMFLEQYEDTLDNIEFLDKDGQMQQTLFSVRDYMLHYFLNFETKESSCRLNVDHMATPFAYTLKIRRDSGFDQFPADRDGFREVPVDLVETFNYLLGLHVIRRITWEHNGLTYHIVHGTAPDNRKVTVVWRNSPKNPAGHEQELEADAAFITDEILREFPDTGVLYVNGHCFAPRATPIEPEFKKLMGA